MLLSVKATLKLSVLSFFFFLNLILLEYKVSVLLSLNFPKITEITPITNSGS